MDAATPSPMPTSNPAEGWPKNAPPAMAPPMVPMAINTPPAAVGGLRGVSVLFGLRLSRSIIQDEVAMMTGNVQCRCPVAIIIARITEQSLPRV